MYSNQGRTGIGIKGTGISSKQAITSPQIMGQPSNYKSPMTMTTDCGKLTIDYNSDNDKGSKMSPQ